MLTYLFPPSFSGGTRQAIELAKGLRQQGVNSIFLGANFSNAPAHDQLDGFVVHRLRTAAGPRLRYLVFALKACVFLLRRRQEYDLALLHSTRPFTFLILIALKCLRKPALVTLTLIGNDDPAALRRKSFLWKIESKALPRFARIVCKSSALQNICVEEKIAPAKLAAIPNGADLSLFQPAHNAAEKNALRAELGLPNKFVAVFVGRIGARKGCDLLFAAWEEIIAREREVLLLLLGPYDEQVSTEITVFQQRLQNYLAHAEEHRMQFVGARAHGEVARYLRAADCFVFPSQREGLPNVVIEAMASGLPVIASHIPGVTTDLIEHEENGVLLQSRSPQELRDAVLKLKQDERLRQRLGERATEKARAKFDLKVVAQQHRRLYASLLAVNGGW